MPTVVQLRSELKKLGLNDKGLKAVLEARLAEYEAQRSHAAASSSGATGDQRVDHDGPRTPLEGERGARLQRGWSLVVEAALSSARRPLQDDQSIQERGKKAQTDATYKKAQTDARAVDSQMVEHTAAPAVLWQLWSERVARVLRACVLCVSVYQLTVCSTALVDGSWPRSMLDDVDDVPSLPALVIALLALSRSSVLHAALPDSSRPWASGLRQQRVGVVLGAGVLLLLLPTVPIAVGSPAIIALLVLVRAAVLMHFADRIARLVVGVLVPALGGFVVWCILKGWRFREGGLRINRLEQHGETWRAAVNESADAITLCRQAGDEDLMQSCAEEAVERLGRAEFAVVDNTESLLCWGVLLSVICHEVLAWIGTRISHWKVRQVAAVHWAKLRHSRHTDIFKAAFQSIDRDNDKSISREELRAALIQIGLRPGEAGTEIETAPDTNEMRTRIDKLMSAVDTNQDGTIDYGEFEKMMNMHVQEGDWAELLDLNSERQVQNAFADCNVRTDGTPRADRRTTSRTELQRVMAHVYSSRQTHKTDKEIAKLAHDMIASVKRRRQPSSAACSVSSGSAGDISYREFRSGLLGKTELHPVQQQMLVDWQLEDRVQALRSWSWQLPFLGPALWVPIPLLLPILFGPALLWIARLVSTCRALGLGGTGVGCPFRFFELTIPWPSTLASQVAALVGGWCSDSACVLLQPFAQHAAETLKLLSEGLFFNVGALQLPPAMLTEAGIRIPGVPLTSFASSVMDEFSGEAKSFGLIGAMAAVPAVHEYYIQFRDAERQREEEAEKERKEASRNMMDLVRQACSTVQYPALGLLLLLFGCPLLICCWASLTACAMLCCAVLWHCAVEHDLCTTGPVLALHAAATASRSPGPSKTWETSVHVHHPVRGQVGGPREGSPEDSSSDWRGCGQVHAEVRARQHRLVWLACYAVSREPATADDTCCVSDRCLCAHWAGVCVWTKMDWAG
jgi:hypothetical protein